MYMLLLFAAAAAYDIFIFIIFIHKRFFLQILSFITFLSYIFIQKREKSHEGLSLQDMRTQILLK